MQTTATLMPDVDASAYVACLALLFESRQPTLHELVRTFFRILALNSFLIRADCSERH